MTFIPKGLEDLNNLKVVDNLPTISIKVNSLPSKSLSYPKNSEIKYRPYTFGEVNKISQSKMSIKDKYEFALAGITCSFDKYDLTMSDFLYIATLRKISTLGTTKFYVPYHCPVCRNNNTKVIESKDLEFDDIEAPALPVKADLSIGKYEFTPISVGRFFKLLDKELLDDKIAYLAFSCSNCDEEYNKNYKAFNDCTFNDGRILNAVDSVLYHGLKDLEFKCPSKISDKNEQACGNFISISLDGGETMILPFREFEESPESMLHFG